MPCSQHVSAAAQAAKNLIDYCGINIVAHRHIQTHADIKMIRPVALHFFTDCADLDDL